MMAVDEVDWYGHIKGLTGSIFTIIKGLTLLLELYVRTKIEFEP